MLPRSPPPTVLLASRILRLRGVKDRDWAAFSSLRPNPNYGTAALAEKTAEKYFGLGAFLRHFVGSEEAMRQLVPTPADWTRLLSVLETNAFNVCDASLLPIGIGLYPRSSIFNHSCTPNATTIFEGKTVFVRALQKIEVGEEITISYIDLSQPVAERRKELADGFGFECNCESCLDESRPGNQRTHLMTGFRCRGECIGCVDAQTRLCDTCGTTMSDDDFAKITADLADAAKVYSESTKQMDAGQFAEVGERLAEVLALETRLLCPKNYRMIKTLTALSSCSIANQDWKSAMRYTKATIPLLEFALANKPRPVIGLQYYNLGKLFWYLCHTELALFWLRKAKLVLGLSHNFDNALFRELSTLVHQVEVEYNARPH